MPRKTKQKRIDEYKELLKPLVNDNDYERAHGYADDLICDLLTELGYQDVVEIYELVGKWYA